MSSNAIDVTSNQQFQEIMRIHSVVPKERSVPRFYCFVADPPSPVKPETELILKGSEIVKSMFEQDARSIDDSMDGSEFKDCLDGHSPVAEEKLPDLSCLSGSDSSDYDPIELIRNQNKEAASLFDTILR